LSSRNLSETIVAFVVAAFLILPPQAAESASAQAAEPPMQSIEELIEEISPGAGLLYLSLEDCIAAALKNNLDIEVERYVPKISDAAVRSQRGVFDPHLYFNATYFDGEIPLPTRVSIATGGLTAVEAEQWFLTGGITGAIPTGLIYDLGIASEHTPFSTITDFFDANGEQKLDAFLTLTQPLLKNFGRDINTTGIRVAVKNKETAVYQLEQKILETVFEVEQAYWELVFAWENLGVKNRSLRLAQNLLDENRIRLRVGVIPQLAVLQSETGVALREEEVFVARSAVQDARDRLIKSTNLFPEELVWDVQIIPQDEPRTDPPAHYREDEHIAAALRNRPELKQLLKQQEVAELGSRFAKNQMLPSLDLNASVGLVGLDSDFDSSFLPAVFLGLPLPPPPDKGIDPAVDDLFSGDNFRWMVGLTFEFPWGNHAARGQYTAANLQVSQLDASVRNLRQVIIQDTRSALRAIDSNWKRVLSTRETTRFRRESLIAEKKKYDVGVSTAHDLLKFEEELAEARANERRATVDYTLSLTNLMRADATLLQARSVKVSVDP